MTKLPNGWEVKKLEDIAKIKGGKRLPKGEKLLDNKTDYCYIRVSDFNNYGTIDINSVKYINFDIYDKLKNYSINHKNLYISIAGTIGKTGIIPKELDGSILTENAVKLEYLQDNISNDFIYYFTLSESFKNQIFDYTKIVAQPKLAITRLKEFQIPLPSLEEQRKIVKILDEKFASLDESIRLAKDDLLSLDELWQSILNDSFNPLKSKLDNDTYTLPTTWKWEKLGDIAQVVTGTTPSKKKEEFYGVGYPLFKPSDLDDGYELFSGSDNLTPLGFENARQFPINTTLVVCIGATIGKVGLTRVEGSCNQQINAILPNENFNSEYLYFLCLSPYFQMILKVNASQTTLPIINKTEFIKLQIPLPPLKEQERIAKELESKAKTIKELKELYTKRLKDYKELKESLLDLAFKGGL